MCFTLDHKHAYMQTRSMSYAKSAVYFIDPSTPTTPPSGTQLSTLPSNEQLSPFGWVSTRVLHLNDRWRLGLEQLLPTHQQRIALWEAICEHLVLLLPSKPARCWVGWALVSPSLKRPGALPIRYGRDFHQLPLVDGRITEADCAGCKVDVCGSPFRTSVVVLGEEDAENVAALLELPWISAARNFSDPMESAHALVARCRHYGITWKTFLDLYRYQEGRCPLCGDILGEEPPVIDHDHQTGLVRGILHGRCNIALGLVEPLVKDKQRLRRVQSYLQAASATSLQRKAHQRALDEALLAARVPTNRSHLSRELRGRDIPNSDLITERLPVPCAPQSSDIQGTGLPS